MKTLSIALLFFVLTLSVYAEEEKPNVCETLAKTAAYIMGKRQENVTITELLKETENNLIKSLIMGAYEKPRYATKDRKINAINDYQNDIHLSCLTKK